MQIYVVLHEPRVMVKNVIADDVQKELARLEESLAVLRSDLDLMLERGDVADGGEHREVLEAYRMFAHDQGWRQRLSDAVRSGLTAEAAVERVQDETRARINRNVLFGAPPDLIAEIAGEDWAFGWNAGALYEFNEHARVGVSWRSMVAHRFSGFVEMINIRMRARAARPVDLHGPEMPKEG